MTEHQEKRRFSRIPFHTRTTLVGPSGSWNSQLIDLSLKGALIGEPPDWGGAVGERYTLEIELGEHAEIVITMEVRIAHIEDGHIGCECLDIDVASISHLRRLMELNLGDASLLERELSALWHASRLH